MADISKTIQQQILTAVETQQPVNLRGGNTKSFLYHAKPGETLSLQAHQGIVNYQPTELVVTAYAGTKLNDLQSTLAEHNQRLPFDPPHFGDDATLGGAIATGLSGSIRPFTGSARDYVLGCRIINGKGQIMQFGGQVMKNVAGYDVSRLMVGAMGSLGVLLEISLKVLPIPASECYLSQSRDTQDALRMMQTLAAQNLPLSGLAYDGKAVHIRLAGAEAAVRAARQKLGGEHHKADVFWTLVNEQQHRFFDGEIPLWRVSVPPATVNLPISGKQLVDWAGGLRWVKTDESAEKIFTLAARHHGHAQLFRTAKLTEIRRQPLNSGLKRLHQQLKQSFDPHGIFNRGQLYPEF
ncbi:MULTISPECIES: glycolate oxidase subunit GlcE [unclassified Methylophaga]|uniref:glycolate oxidase subunit GlcE n=1 Tax=unclassified Methylophaga TaxID=2629249 RepID=UPI000C8B3F71|nr:MULTISPECIES: glycolate oxidase subunit GlcE [unclassified Methylophaga]MBN47156.1 glycolate oxidase subunit GlcE [Methylophaga sp.]|tara:strand:+ start:51384 stop:52439 length:1056 start_codon:yes stop_codon:yes gene_type:complete